MIVETVSIALNGCGVRNGYLLTLSDKINFLSYGVSVFFLVDCELSTF